MKTRITTILCAIAIGLGSTTASFADENNPFLMATDVIVVRPVCLASTIVGSALFVVALPVAAISKSIKPVANAMVIGPAKATFTRPVGDMDALAGDDF